MASEIGKRVGRRIKEIREGRGLTQAQVACMLGKSIETISNFERGKVVTSLETLERLGRQLGVQTKVFFDEQFESVNSFEQVSENAIKVRNAADFLPEDDLEIIAGLVEVLEARRRKR